MRILIAGGCGFVGSGLALYLQERGHRITVVDNLVRSGSELHLAELQRAKIAFQHSDLRNSEDLKEWPEDTEMVLACAAQPSVVTGYSNPRFDIHNNTLGTLNLLDWARANLAGVIFWSSNKVYSGDRVNALPRKELETRWQWTADPTHTQGFDPAHGIAESFSLDGGNKSLYGLSKAMADLACQEYADAFGLPVLINRFSALAGPGQLGKSEQGWVTWFTLAFHLGLPLEIYGWNGRQVRDVLFLSDLCRLVELELKELPRLSGEVYNVGGGPENSISLLEATVLLRKLTDYQPPISILDETRCSDHCIYISDSRKAQQVFGWRPEVNLEQGFSQTLDWVITNERPLRALYGRG